MWGKKDERERRIERENGIKERRVAVVIEEPKDKKGRF